MVNKKKWYAQSQKQKLLNWMKHDSDIILLNRTNNNRKLNTANTIKVRNQTLIHSRSEKAPKSSVNCMIYGPVKSKPVLHYPVNWNQSIVQLIEICRLLRAIHNVRTVKVTYLIDLLAHILTKDRGHQKNWCTLLLRPIPLPCSFLVYILYAWPHTLFS